jgi:glycosyltransferase involved in cell wall biosynthesis
MVKKKIIFLTDTLTNYQYEFYDKLSQSHKIKVIVSNKKKYSNYNFDFPRRPYIFFLEKFKEKKESINKIITNHHPKIIVFCGYRLKYINYIKKVTYPFNTKYFYWLERINPEKKIKIYILDTLFKFLLKKIDGILAVGNEAKNYYLKFNKNVFNVPYSINITKINKKKIYKKLKILFVGQLIERKGIDIIISSIKALTNKHLQNLEFTFVGNGKYKEQIQKLSKKYSGIKYKKFQTQKKLKIFFENNHILIFVSRFDGWGVVPMQGMSHSMFIILGRNCGVREILNPLGSNIIVDINQTSLLDALKYCINNQTDIINQGKKNRGLFTKSICNIDNAIKSINKAFNSV